MLEVKTSGKDNAEKVLRIIADSILSKSQKIPHRQIRQMLQQGLWAEVLCVSLDSIPFGPAVECHGETDSSHQRFRNCTTGERLNGLSRD